MASILPSTANVGVRARRESQASKDRHLSDRGCLSKLLALRNSLVRCACMLCSNTHWKQKSPRILENAARSSAPAQVRMRTDRIRVDVRHAKDATRTSHRCSRYDPERHLDDGRGFGLLSYRQLGRVHRHRNEWQAGLRGRQHQPHRQSQHFDAIRDRGRHGAVPRQEADLEHSTEHPDLGRSANRLGIALEHARRGQRSDG